MLLITFSFPVLLNNTVSSRTNHFIISVSFFYFNAGYRHVLKIYIYRFETRIVSSYREAGGESASKIGHNFPRYSSRMRVNFELPFETLRNSIRSVLASRRELCETREAVVGDNVATGDRETAVKSITARETASISSLTNPSVRILLRSRFRLTSTRNLQFKSRVHRDDKVSCEASSVNSVNYRYKFQRFLEVR